MEELLARLGFALMGKVVGQRMDYLPEARQLAGVDGALYVFLNTDGSVWKVGMTRKGFSRADYTARSRWPGDGSPTRAAQA